MGVDSIRTRDPYTYNTHTHTNQPTTKIYIFTLGETSNSEMPALLVVWPDFLFLLLYIWAPHLQSCYSNKILYKNCVCVCLYIRKTLRNAALVVCCSVAAAVQLLIIIIILYTDWVGGGGGAAAAAILACQFLLCSLSVAAVIVLLCCCCCWINSINATRLLLSDCRASCIGSELVSKWFT